MSSRQPSFFERYYILRGAHGLYSNFNISAKYNKKILAINLSNALRSLILENPVFAVNFFRDNANDILEDGANFTLRPLDFVRFDTVVTFRKLPSPQFNETTFREIDKLVVKVDQKISHCGGLLYGAMQVYHRLSCRLSCWPGYWTNNISRSIVTMRYLTVPLVHFSMTYY